jgi:hypothetical protein
MRCYTLCFVQDVGSQHLVAEHDWNDSAALRYTGETASIVEDSQCAAAGSCKMARLKSLATSYLPNRLLHIGFAIDLIGTVSGLRPSSTQSQCCPSSCANSLAVPSLPYGMA